MNDAQLLRVDLSNVRATGRDLDVCDALEALLDQGYLKCQWDAHDNRPIRVWKIDGHPKWPLYLPTVRGEIRSLMVEMLVREDVVFSTEINTDTHQVQWMLASKLRDAPVM
jgi:hypothetical protein